MHETPRPRDHRCAANATASEPASLAASSAAVAIVAAAVAALLLASLAPPARDDLSGNAADARAGRFLHAWSRGL